MKYTRILFPVLCLFVCSCRRSHNIQDYYSLQKKKSFILETKTDVDMTELNDILCTRQFINIDKWKNWKGNKKNDPQRTGWR